MSRTVGHVIFHFTEASTSDAVQELHGLADCMLGNEGQKQEKAHWVRVKNDFGDHQQCAGRICCCTKRVCQLHAVWERGCHTYVLELPLQRDTSHPEHSSCPTCIMLLSALASFDAVLHQGEG